jgi:hypothetical protein
MRKPHLIRWDADCRALIGDTVQQMIADGMTRPNIRAVLYRLLKLPRWTKQHYDTLCIRLGEWRDAGLFPYGVFSDDSGVRRRPSTEREIAETIEAWKEMEPAALPADGILRALLVEHGALVAQIDDWCDGRALVVSSEGQLRRENLWTATEEWKQMLEELGGTKIVVYALMDWDVAGRKHIYDAHHRWFTDIANLDFVRFGLTEAQLAMFGMPNDEDQQIDGVIGLNPAWWRE